MKYQIATNSTLKELHLGLQSILPNDCGINVRAILQNEDIASLIYQREILLTHKMSKKRLNDFSSGRLAAKDALSQIDIYNFPLLIDTNRAPLWPRSTIGSISHSKNICIAAVVNCQKIKALGVDIETTKLIDKDVLNLICDPIELSHLDQLESKQLGQKLSNGKIIFSIKESIFKCLNPLLGCWIDFKEMQVTLNPIEKSYIAFANSKNNKLSRLNAIKGRWYSNDYFHITSCWL